MSERYQREIEEILQQAGEHTPTKEAERAHRRSTTSAFGGIGRGVAGLIYRSSSRLLAIGAVLLLLAILVSVILPGFLGPFMWLGLILFILVYALFFARPGSSPEKRWRGRAIEPSPREERRVVSVPALAQALGEAVLPGRVALK